MCRFDYPLGVRHQAEHVARIVEDSGDLAGRAVAIFEIAEGYPAFSLETVERCFVRLVIPVVVRDWEDDLLARVILSGEQALAVFDSQGHVTANELQPSVAHQRTGQHPRLGQHLEAVANADHRHSARRCLLDYPHHRRTCGHRAGTQIVAVGKAARHADEVEAIRQLAFLVPHHRRLTTSHQLQCDGEIAVAVGSWKDDNGGVHSKAPSRSDLIACKYAGNVAAQAFSSRSIWKFSITVLASSLRHI